ncbi:hypothetical protein D7223_31390 [Micromonospora endolithica]|uniref:DUF4383 domain-containing protein n=1 Tax=Micromonospora endolithica TaxID=230091 RepID=A0A3A9YSH3_9ACTN|nr:hypothetical protein D7223_31390 [Micromonospora endolithica]
MLETYVGRVDAQAQRSERNRLNLLHLHAAAACYIAPGFALIGQAQQQSATFVLLREIPGAPISLGALFGLGGVALAWGTVRSRSRWAEAGLLLMLFWYLLVAVSFGGAVVVWLVQDRQGAAPAIYAHGVYLHLAIVMAVHLATLRRIDRSGSGVDS